ncbi:PREDICTED: uncharacterized protein LOC105363003 [Ceratosolen solmsi marchali]|uniref:Uncharacterized protein LOC105363003 n=1 Tax=Ceratosolen solmsi marchali TaxID=326594 RepID=A0AAJ6YIT8_9HYME|nr:PREDICTED: uncharacterized protein LOC105363003 [Ceratosolen solmsi marchali]
MGEWRGEARRDETRRGEASRGEARCGEGAYGDGEEVRSRVRQGSENERERPGVTLGSCFADSRRGEERQWTFTRNPYAVQRYSYRRIATIFEKSPSGRVAGRHGLAVAGAILRNPPSPEPTELNEPALDLAHDLALTQPRRGQPPSDRSSQVAGTSSSDLAPSASRSDLWAIADVAITAARLTFFFLDR